MTDRSWSNPLSCFFYLIFLLFFPSFDYSYISTILFHHLILSSASIHLFIAYKANTIDPIYAKIYELETYKIIKVIVKKSYPDYLGGWSIFLYHLFLSNGEKLIQAKLRVLHNFHPIVLSTQYRVPLIIGFKF